MILIITLITKNMNTIKYSIISNGVEVYRTSLTSTLNAICHCLDLKEVNYIVEEKQLNK